MQYISGVAYTTKEGKKAEQEKAKSKPIPQPIMRNERANIRIVMKNPEKKQVKKQISRIKRSYRSLFFNSQK